ncbi:hypothetical protein OUZ56_028175 [Daphnia magna]|uniref:Uncharacterized protein n=1 Tax=Daphnia magna TaxID=35525 RepID=A0ABR0B374_9CRUS|nr:hypothetical protein OUZ56_028175 [Daphnia magna]
MYVPNWYCQSQKSCHFLLVRFNEKSPAIARGRLFLRIEFGSIECEQSENKEKLNWARFSLVTVNRIFEVVKPQGLLSSFDEIVSTASSILAAYLAHLTKINSTRKRFD